MMKARFPENVEYIFAVDSDDEESVKGIPGAVISEAPSTCIKAWNEGALKSTGDVIMLVSDDMVPPIYWDALIEQQFEPYGDAPKCLWVSDGHRTDDLIVWVIQTRSRYLSQVHDGKPYMFYPGYHGVYADNEYTARARKDGVVIDARHIVFEHEHPSFGTAEWDETYRRQNADARFEEGRKLFELRN